MQREPAWTALVAFALMAGCAPAASLGAQPTGELSGAAVRPKILTIAQLNSIKTYGPWDFSNTQGGGAALAEIHTSGLVIGGKSGGLEPRLATKVPSLDDGSVVIQPDGHMTTTWKLQPNITWHDGTPFTADDLIFSAEVHTTRELLSSIDAAITYSERREAPDATTFVVTWKQPYYRALQLGSRDLWPLPRHILGEAFAGDKLNFRSAPYFTSEYINLGPFRLVDFGYGEEQVFERYDAYFLGRAKLDRIVLRTIPDPTVVVTNFRAGAIDIAPEQTLPLDIAFDLREELRKNGNGIMRSRQYNWWYVWFQFDPTFAHPPQLSRDVRIRRALLYAIDRGALRETFMPGFPDTNGDSFMPKNDARGPVVGQPFARYPYDPTRAAQELTDAGWKKGPDGKIVDQEGSAVQIELRGSPAYAKVVSLVADFWRRMGMDASEHPLSTAEVQDNEFKAKFPGGELRARGVAEGVLVSFDGRLLSGPQNRWAGANSGHYANSALDGLMDRVYGTLDEGQQASALRDVGELLATDLPAIPMYFIIAFSVTGKNVDALADDYTYAGTGPLLSRNAHLWDIRA